MPKESDRGSTPSSSMADKGIVSEFLQFPYPILFAASLISDVPIEDLDNTIKTAKIVYAQRFPSSLSQELDDKPTPTTLEKYAASTTNELDVVDSQIDVQPYLGVIFDAIDNPFQRECLQLRINGYMPAEISKTLDIGRNKVAMALQAARRKAIKALNNSSLPRLNS